MSDDSSLSDVVALDDGEWDELLEPTVVLKLLFLYWIKLNVLSEALLLPRFEHPRLT